MNHWLKNGVPDQVFEHPRKEQPVRNGLEGRRCAAPLRRFIPMGSILKTVRRSSANPSGDESPGFIRLPRMPGGSGIPAAPGQVCDASEERNSPRCPARRWEGLSLFMDLHMRVTGYIILYFDQGSNRQFLHLDSALLWRCTGGMTKSNGCSCGRMGFAAAFPIQVTGCRSPRAGRIFSRL